MRNLQFILIVFAISVISSMAFAKDAPNRKHHEDPKAIMEAYKKLAIPGEPHHLFATLVGSWATVTKEWMDPNQPPIESKGAEEIRMLLGGRFLQGDYSGEMMGQPYNGLGISGYDNLRKRYVSLWLDSMSTGFFIMEGTASADGKTITLTGQHPEPGGGSMTHRAIWKIIDENNQTFEMYGAHHGGKEMKMMEITYTRK